MGRKKKEKKDEKINITYKGNVKVSLVKGDTIVSTKTYHNLGKLPMFTFLVQCLQGDYITANPNRPKFIQVFSAGADGEPVPTTNISSLLENNQRTLTKIIYTGLPKTEFYSQGSIDPISGETLVNDEALVTFKFMIPFTQIYSFDDINMFAIYSQKNYVGVTSPSAYFFLIKKENGTEVLDSLNISGADQDKDYSILIQWTVILSN